MVLNKKVTGKAVALPIALAIGLLIDIAIMLVFVSVVAHLVIGEKMDEGAIGYAVMVVLPLITALGAFVSAGMVKSRCLLVCMMSGAIYYLTLIGVTAMFFGGQYDDVLTTAVLVCIGAAMAGVTKGMHGQRGRTRRRKFRHS